MATVILAATLEQGRAHGTRYVDPVVIVPIGNLSDTEGLIVNAIVITPGASSLPTFHQALGRLLERQLHTP
jgi:hypothetical protein